MQDGETSRSCAKEADGLSRDPRQPEETAYLMIRQGESLVGTERAAAKHQPRGEDTNAKSGPSTYLGSTNKAKNG